MLQPRIIEGKVINNGIDLSVFRSGNKAKLRQELGIPAEAFVLSYVVAGRMKSHAYKDFETIKRALELLEGNKVRQQIVIFLGLGEEKETVTKGGIERRFIPYQTSMKNVAKYYQVADIYLHAARADTFPNVILEALACGTPVIATAVGGITEQVIEGETGYLVPAGGYQEMAFFIRQLMEDHDIQRKLSLNAATVAKKRFSMEKMIDNYMAFYQEILEQESLTNNKVA
jgi:glycosyltransferase involved in cell wall biosynthesis